MYLAVALSKIAYGMDVWYILPHKPVGTTRNTRSVGSLRSLQKIQCIATLTIMDGLHTTPTNLLDAHAGAFPWNLLCLRTCSGQITSWFTSDSRCSSLYIIFSHVHLSVGNGFRIYHMTSQNRNF